MNSGNHELCRQTSTSTATSTTWEAKRRRTTTSRKWDTTNSNKRAMTNGCSRSTTTIDSDTMNNSRHAPLGSRCNLGFQYVCFFFQFIFFHLHIEYFGNIRSLLGIIFCSSKNEILIPNPPSHNHNPINQSHFCMGSIHFILILYLH